MKIDETLEMAYPQKLKPNAQTGSCKFYFDPLFDYPFGGVEIHNARALMEFISSEYDGIRPAISPEEMAIWLKEFHTKLAEALHNGGAVLDMVPE